MKEERSQITLEIDGEKKQFPRGITYRELAEQYQHTKKNRILLVLADNRLRELYRKAKDKARVRFMTIEDTAGYNAYRRSMCLMMLKAIHNVLGHGENYQVRIHFAVSGGLYCTMQGEVPLTAEFLEKVKLYMEQLCRQAIPIEKRTMDTGEAVELFHSHHMYDKEQLFCYRRVSKTNVYSMGGFEDYYYGYMVPDTSCLNLFDLKLYQEGFVLCLPSREDPGRVKEFKPMEKLFHVQNHSLKWGETLDIFSVADLNRKVVAGETKELILTQEAYHEKQLARIAEEIASHPEKKLVMIAGPPHRGKPPFLTGFPPSCPFTG